MNYSLSRSLKWTFRLQSHQFRRFVSVDAAPASCSETLHFQILKDRLSGNQKPIVFKISQSSPTQELPALVRWFQRHESSAQALSPYLDQYHNADFPYELVSSSAENRNALVMFCEWLESSTEDVDNALAGILRAVINESQPDITSCFFQLQAPLKLLVRALEFNKTNNLSSGQIIQLYIAQSSLLDLPRGLQDDLPTPTAVLKAGKGDVYSSSLWMGTQPTYTPLHRDPNPNLFCQLFSGKCIRLLEPAAGRTLFYQVQARIGQQANSQIRSTEMMEGAERKALHDAVWDQSTRDLERIYEAQVEPGDALFIPTGWWHSVKSVGDSSSLNASVNWWFR